MQGQNIFTGVTPESRFKNSLNLTYEQKYAVLMELGNMAQKNFNKNIFFGSGSYDLSVLKNALHFSPNVDAFENTYYIDGTQSIRNIALWFEYGTGLHATAKTPKPITTKNKSHPYMRFEPKSGRSKSGGKQYTGAVVFTTHTQGVKPIFMFKRTIKWLEQNRPYLEVKAMKKAGVIE